MEMVGINTLFLGIWSHFVKDHFDVHIKYSEADVIKMLEFLIDNTYMEFSGQTFQQILLHSNGHKLRPLTCRALFTCMRRSL